MSRFTLLTYSRASATVKIKRDAAATDERIWRAADAERIQRVVVTVQRPAAPDYTVASHDQNFLMHRVKWRHSNLWSRYDLYVVGQRSILWKLSGRFVALFSNKTEPAGLRKRPYYQKCPYYQVISQEQTFLWACPTSWRENSWRRYGMKKLRYVIITLCILWSHCVPTFCLRCIY